MDRVQYESIVVQDLINLEKDGGLNLSPWYQRRSVWTVPQKAYLINTLHEQMPIPALYIRHSIDIERERSIREVVDGQQRSRAILEYYRNEFKANHPSHESKVMFGDLTSEQKNRFLLTSIPAGYLLGAEDSDVIEIFGRINSVSKSLNPQEKRNAKFSGDFKQFCLRESASRVNFWRNNKIFTSNDIARMGEVQFVSDIVLNLIKGLSDYSAARLDKIYQEYDEGFPEAGEIRSRLARCFDAVADIDQPQLRDTIFVRQPLLFSLLLVLDELEIINTRKLENVVNEIDQRFNSESGITEEDVKFRSAASSSTQRISQRHIRHDYIRSFF